VTEEGSSLGDVLPDESLPSPSLVSVAGESGSRGLLQPSPSSDADAGRKPK
jgi:hypothetical protein